MSRSRRMGQAGGSGGVFTRSHPSANSAQTPAVALCGGWLPPPREGGVNGTLSLAGRTCRTCGGSRESRTKAPSGIPVAVTTRGLSPTQGRTSGHHGSIHPTDLSTSGNWSAHFIDGCPVASTPGCNYCPTMVRFIAVSLVWLLPATPLIASLYWVSGFDRLELTVARSIDRQSCKHPQREQSKSTGNETSQKFSCQLQWYNADLISWLPLVGTDNSTIGSCCRLCLHLSLSLCFAFHC